MTTKPATSGFRSSENVAKMQASSTLAAMQAADALRAEGANVVDFGAGEPDFDTPDNIKRAAAEAMRAGKTKYTATARHPESATGNHRFLRAGVWRGLRASGSDGHVWRQAGNFQRGGES